VRLLKCNVFGCHAHRCNLVLCKFGDEVDDGKLRKFLDIIHACMKKVNTIKNVALFCQHTEYSVVIKNKHVGQLSLTLHHNSKRCCQA
jgi:hypothetical protein